MIPITYFRSSSYNNWFLCQQQYLLSYILGILQPSGKKAEMGTILHKVMECLANCKKCKQEEVHSFEDDAIGVVEVDYDMLNTNTFVDEIYDRVFGHYSDPKRSIHGYTKYDYRTIREWVFKTLNDNYGIFDPRKRNIVQAEQHFDFPIDEPWAYYEYELPTTGEKISGQLCLKGTIDLITQVSPNTLEVIDWKTGKRIDWGTGKEKDFNKLSIDPQLRMYYLAISKLYPDMQDIVMSINFINDGGPYTMAYERSDIPGTLEIIRKCFEKIRKTARPQLKSYDGSHWFCNKVCHFGKTMHPKDGTKTICQYIKEKTMRYGLNQVIADETAKGYNVGHYQNPGE